MQNDNKTKYICPPKLQTKLLIGFWTVQEVFVMAVLLISGVGLLSPVILSMLFVFGVFTGRFDLINNPEKNLFTKLKARIKYYRSVKTYKQ